MPSAPVDGAMVCGQKSFKLVWRCHQLLANVHLSRLPDEEAIMRYQDLHTDLLAFTLQVRKPSIMRPSKNCATSHRLKRGPFPSNVVGRIIQQVRTGGKGGSLSQEVLIPLPSAERHFLYSRDTRRKHK